MGDVYRARLAAPGRSPYVAKGVPRRSEFVQSFSTGAKYQVSKDTDAYNAAWTPDGKELSYVASGGQFATISVTTQPSFTFSTPTPMPLPESTVSPFLPRNYDITGDGKRFIGVLAPGATQGISSVRQIQVVLNWFEELKAKVPTK